MQHNSDLIKSIRLRNRRIFNDNKMIPAKNSTRVMWQIVNNKISTKNHLQNIRLTHNGDIVSTEKIPDRFLTITSKLHLQINKDKSMSILRKCMG